MGEYSPHLREETCVQPLKGLTCAFVRDCSVVLIPLTMLQNIQTVGSFKAVIFIHGGDLNW